MEFHHQRVVGASIRRQRILPRTRNEKRCPDQEQYQG
jgi:hypothetical protein